MTACFSVLAVDLVYYSLSRDVRSRNGSTRVCADLQKRKRSEAAQGTRELAREAVVREITAQNGKYREPVLNIRQRLGLRHPRRYHVMAYHDQCIGLGTNRLKLAADMWTEKDKLD